MSFNRLNLKQKAKIDLEYKNHWEGYAARSESSTRSVGITLIETKKNKSEIKKINSKTYTHLFMNELKYEIYLNSTCKRMFQLGAAGGQFLAESKNYSVMGYDYADSSIKILNDKGLPHRKINLSQLEDENTLAYQKELAEDLTYATNILAIRVLEYVDERAQMLLIFALIQQAKPGSVFFIVNMVSDEAIIGTTKPNYIPSFFAPRTDMQFLKLEQMGVATEQTSPDEVLIVRKI